MDMTPKEFAEEFYGRFMPEQQLLPNVIEEIKQERIRQDEQWGGAEHDDQHSSSLFMSLIEKQAYKAYTPNGDGKFRKRFIKIAALAIAAVESIDRKETSDDL
jgi:hypothetical protein